MVALPAGGSAVAAPIPPTGTLDVATDADVRLTGDQADARVGGAVAPAGDVNGDGLADVIVGAPLHDAAQRRNSGAARVVFGTPPAGAPATAAGLAAVPGFLIEGAGAGDAAGTAVAAAGDVDGDGLGDVLVGAPGADGAGRGDAGVVYLVRGRTDGGTVDLAAGMRRCPSRARRRATGSARAGAPARRERRRARRLRRGRAGADRPGRHPYALPDAPSGAERASRS